ncbi:MAG TPA: HAD family acid phosphatase [Vicinamibacterales bacterium]|nr:HAD family acid phosphatase [Vicinamibacterales bacterium]
MHVRRTLPAAVFATIATGIIVTACRTAGSTPSATPSPQTTPRRTHENLNAVLWMQTAAEYRASALQAYRIARLEVDAALADRQWTAALEQTGDPSALPPAVVLDLDETVLDNSAFEAREVADSTPWKAVPYSEAAWNAWVAERKAGAIPGAAPFLKYAVSRGVTPIYITGRSAAVEQATREQLAALGIPVDAPEDDVLTQGEKGWNSSDKGARRAWVAARYRILLLIGDNLEDFLSVPAAQKSIAGRAALTDRYERYWGEKWIVLPNPTYGSWEQAIAFGLAHPSDDQMLAAKYKALQLKR